MAGGGTSALRSSSHRADAEGLRSLRYKHLGVPADGSPGEQNDRADGALKQACNERVVLLTECGVLCRSAADRRLAEGKSQEEEA